MANNYTENLRILAEKISKACSYISKDEISKEYTIGENPNTQIVIKSDSGYEAIYIGNLASKTKGYMCLYTNNTPKRNSFPTKKTIAGLLEKVLNKEQLEEGEGKAAYFKWKEFGSMKKQLNYYSEIVCKLAAIDK